MQRWNPDFRTGRSKAPEHKCLKPNERSPKNLIEKSATAEGGTVEEVLPREMYRVRLDDGRTVRAGLATQSRHGIVRLIAGSRVRVRVSPHDPGRGQIVAKL